MAVMTIVSPSFFKDSATTRAHAEVIAVIVVSIKS
ncbi:hypothetical protein COLO4_12106 [Corchorus olitorius]|uniref:Uncharacterized protein n=1 Tax=Corchorus olitorius TaxID=93759 RepID=A0A1R3K2E5_9ROSI|nr:hypothetical protein COLO4_12106 [Corchorus olitorius]